MIWPLAGGEDMVQISDAGLTADRRAEKQAVCRGRVARAASLATGPRHLGRAQWATRLYCQASSVSGEMSPAAFCDAPCV